VIETNINDGGHSWLGMFIHTPALQQLEILDNTLVNVDSAGIIQSILASDHPQFDNAVNAAQRNNTLTRSGEYEFMIPGLVDLHIHAPQWPQLGKALHLPLQDWLQSYTFPLEARFNNAAFAESVYARMVDQLLANGTTSAVYFATIHSLATEILAQICVNKGQRAWVGRVAMDEPTQCPDYYRDPSSQVAIEKSEASIQTIRSIAGNQDQRVKPILTPRFIPSCTDDLLLGLGELAERHRCHIQTHCSESDWEHQFVIDRHGISDTQSLDNFGLLTRHTVLAHANFIADSDIGVIKNRQSGIAHCPYSNQYFSDAVFPLRKILKAGVNTGLGTDISGGPSASMFDSCRQSIAAARMLESGIDASQPQTERGIANSRIDFVESFYLATVGGGVVLDEPIGQFKPGYRFDALLIDPQANDSNLMYFPELDSIEELFQKTIYAATQANVKQVWVGGELCGVDSAN